MRDNCITSRIEFGLNFHDYKDYNMYLVRRVSAGSESVLRMERSHMYLGGFKCRVALESLSIQL